MSVVVARGMRSSTSENSGRFRRPRGPHMAGFEERKVDRAKENVDRVTISIER